MSRFALVSVAISLFLIGCCSYSIIPPLNDVRSVHKEWMVTHGRQYDTLEEEMHRFHIFAMNLDYVLQHNVNHTLGHASFAVGMNAHMDLTFEEYKERKLNFHISYGSRIAASHKGFYGYQEVPLLRSNVPSSFDWRERGAVTPVKDQGTCGSCWSFSSTGAIEGAHFIATGELVSLSEEQLINCVNDGKNDCRTGGDYVDAFQYVISTGGIVPESSYPYDASDHQSCAIQRHGANFAARISGYKKVPQNDENALLYAVLKAPVSIGIDASHKSFQFYKSGVYDEPECCRNCSEDQLDHAVLLVGYGREEGKDYWLVKNSWSSSWGDEGYVKIRRNDDGLCGVPVHGVYPVA